MLLFYLVRCWSTYHLFFPSTSPFLPAEDIPTSLILRIVTLTIAD